jgi:DNA-binding CsgD family transcriptional regulator
MGGRMVITARDLDKMMGIIRPVSDASANPMPESTMTGLHDLIPCDNVSFTRYDSKTQEFDFDQSVGSEDDPVELDSLDEAFWTHYWSSKPCSYPDVTKDLITVTSASDFLSRRQLHSTGMYWDYFRPLGIEREMMLCLPSRPGRVLRLLFFRGAGADFSDRERAMLALLRPHLFAAYQAQAIRQHPRPDLTTRQRQLLHLVADGNTNRQIARRMSITEATVRKHLENIFLRTGARNRTEAVIRALGREER